MAWNAKLSFLAALAGLTGAARADNCDAIMAQIEAKLRAGGLNGFALTTLDAAAPPQGRTVGTCGSGQRRIVYLAAQGATVTGAVGAGVNNAPAAAASSAAPQDAGPERATPADKIPTECKDGSIVIGPDCRNRRAVRMRKSDLDRAASAP